MFRKEVDIRDRGTYLRRGNFFSHHPSSLFSRLVKPATSDLCHLSLSSLLATLYEKSTIGTGRQQDFTRRKVSKEIRSPPRVNDCDFSSLLWILSRVSSKHFFFLNVLSCYTLTFIR